MPLLADDYQVFRAETARLTNLVVSTATLQPAHRKFIAEIALLRLAILIENSMKILFCKITCGATYLDGSTPIVLAPQRNIPAAVKAMQTHNRARGRSLPWNDGKEIRDNIEHVIDNADPCVQTLINHAAFLTEVRFLRNHIAHRNDNSRKNFAKVIRKYYGAKVPGVTCGNLLLSPRVSAARPLLDIHIVSANIMMKELVRA